MRSHVVSPRGAAEIGFDSAKSAVGVDGIIVLRRKQQHDVSCFRVGFNIAGDIGYDNIANAVVDDEMTIARNVDLVFQNEVGAAPVESLQGAGAEMKS